MSRSMQRSMSMLRVLVHAQHVHVQTSVSMLNGHINAACSSLCSTDMDMDMQQGHECSILWSMIMDTQHVLEHAA
jgi:hypothetical protein